MRNKEFEDAARAIPHSSFLILHYQRYPRPGGFPNIFAGLTDSLNAACEEASTCYPGWPAGAGRPTGSVHRGSFGAQPAVMPDAIKTYTFRPDLPLEIELTTIAQTMTSFRALVTKPSRAGFYHIIWVQRGEATHTVDFQPVRLRPGSMLFVRTQRVHMFDTSADYDGQVVLFTDAFFNQSTADQQFLRTTILYHDLLDIPVLELAGSVVDFASLFGQLATEIEQPADEVHSPILRNQLHTLLLLADRERRRQGLRHLDRGPDLDYTVLFRDLLEAHYQTLRTVRGYAARMNVSEKRLAQATGRTVGKLPKHLIDERVTLEAKRLLVHTRASIKEVGFALGFDEPTNFIKYFRRQAGTTPIEFRERHGQ